MKSRLLVSTIVGAGFLAVGATNGKIVNFMTQATSDLASICESIIKYGAQDSFDSFSDNQRVNLAKYVVCQEKVSTYKQTQDIGFSLGIPIEETMGAALGFDVSESNYSFARSKFCSSDFSYSTASNRSLISVRQFSKSVGDALQTCVSKYYKGFSASVSQSKDKKSFSIRLQYDAPSGGSNAFELQELSAKPSVIECAQGEQKATKGRPIKIAGSKVIVCQNKSPDQSVLLAINTSVGSAAGPSGAGIELSTTVETLTDLKNRLDRLESSVIPSGTIAYFNAKDCPPAWNRADELTGFYPVGLNPNNRDAVGAKVGTGLSNLENRPAGRHSHTYPEEHMTYGGPTAKQIDSGNGGSWGFELRVLTTNEASDLVPNTNAPYVQLSACKKN